MEDTSFLYGDSPADNESSPVPDAMAEEAGQPDDVTGMHVDHLTLMDTLQNLGVSPVQAARKHRNETRCQQKTTIARSVSSA